MSTELDRKFLNHLAATRLFEPPGLALLAVSGGVDSVALLDLMVCVAEELGLSLAVAHVIHGISQAAADAAPEVKQLSRSYHVPFYLEELELGPGASETSARQGRYEALRAIQKAVNARYLVTAHQFDDQVETVLYRFLRGSGPAGLAGIPAKGPDGLVRPLLPFERVELEQWLSYRFPDPSVRPAIFHDPANADARHDRSWLRHHLLPYLRQRFGAELDRRLEEVAVHAAEDRAAWTSLLYELPGLDFRCEPGAVEVARAPFGRYDKLLSQAVLRAAAREIGCRLGRTHSELLQEFATSSSSGRTLQLGSEFSATLVFDRLRLGRIARDSAPEAVELDLLRGSKGGVTWGEWQFSWRTDKVEMSERDSFGAWVTYGPCEIRPFCEGDRINPLGGVGTRKVSRLLMEARIPAEERKRYPVVARGDDVLWIPGVCRSDSALPDIGEFAVRMDARAG